MSARSPLIPPSRHHRRRRHRRSRRRRRLLRRLLAVAALGLATALVLLAIGGPGNGGRATDAVESRHAVPGTSATHHARSAGAAAPAAAPGTDGAALPFFSFHHPPRAALLFDVATGRVLWALNATRVLPIASLTKMMTALLVARSGPADAPVLITHNAVNAAGSKVGVLPKGKHVRLQTLLYGLLLPSGNDAAVALAEHAAGSVRTFVRRMNEEAARMGLHCTRYVSPDGLEDANRSCATDLETLARADLDQPRIARVAASASAVQPLPIKGGRVWLYNNNPLLVYGYPGADGLKTGETEAAGLCLVGTAQRDGVRLGVVLLHSPELGRQAEALLNAGFQDVYHQAPRAAPPVPKGR